jgi:hypothetical protein
MIFQSPNVLWALSLLAIPIIIHLFQFKRYKQLLFSDVSLLKEVQSRSQTKNQLKHILILLTRMALIAFAVLAFARPFIPATDTNVASKTNVSIYVDNSFSMQNAGENGNLFTEALQRAFEIAESYPSETNFQLITNDLAPFQKRFLDFDGFVEALDQLSVSPSNAVGQRIVDFHASALRENETDGGVIYLISDFNEVIDANITANSNQELRLVKLIGRETSNVSIDSAWIETPVLTKGNQEKLNIRISNRGNELKTDLPFDVYLQDQLISSLILTIEPNSSIDTNIQLLLNEAGYLKGKLSIEDRPITYDNDFYFTLTVRSDISVVEISGEKADSKPFKKLFQVEGETDYQKMTSENILLDTVAKADFVILNEVEKYTSGLIAMMGAKLEEGKNVFIILPKNLASNELATLNTEFGIELGAFDSARLSVVQINLDDEVYASVFAEQPENLNLPRSGAHWVLKQKNGSSNLMSFINSDAFITRFPKGKGNLFVLSSPLSEKGNTFSQHALFVPTLYNAALLAGNASEISNTVGAVKVDLPSAALGEMLKMTANDSGTFIPTVAYDGLYLGDQINTNGFFDLLSENKKVATYAFNFVLSESNIKPIESEALTSILTENGINFRFIEKSGEQLKDEISKADLGQELWVWAVAIALLFLIIESILIKVFNR